METIIMLLSGSISPLSTRTSNSQGLGAQQRANKRVYGGLLGVLMKGALPTSTHWFLTHAFWHTGKSDDK